MAGAHRPRTRRDGGHGARCACVPVSRPRGRRAGWRPVDLDALLAQAARGFADHGAAGHGQQASASAAVHRQAAAARSAVSRTSIANATKFEARADILLEDGPRGLRIRGARRRSRHPAAEARSGCSSHSTASSPRATATAAAPASASSIARDIAQAHGGIAHLAITCPAGAWKRVLLLPAAPLDSPRPRASTHRLTIVHRRGPPPDISQQRDRDFQNRPARRHER